MESFYSCDLCTKAGYFEGVATQENSDLGKKRLFALFLYSVTIPSCNFLQLQTKDECELP